MEPFTINLNFTKNSALKRNVPVGSAGFRITWMEQKILLGCHPQQCPCRRCWSWWYVAVVLAVYTLTGALSSSPAWLRAVCDTLACMEAVPQKVQKSVGIQR